MRNAGENLTSPYLFRLLTDHNISPFLTRHGFGRDTLPPGEGIKVSGLSFLTLRRYKLL